MRFHKTNYGNNIRQSLAQVDGIFYEKYVRTYGAFWERMNLAEVGIPAGGRSFYNEYNNKPQRRRNQL